jgi:hypothetical protein
VNTEDGSREKLTEAMMSFITLKANKAAADAEKSKVDQLNSQLQMYLGFLWNPLLTAQMRVNYEGMITNILNQVMRLMNLEMKQQEMMPPRRSPRGTLTKAN